MTEGRRRWLRLVVSLLVVVAVLVLLSLIWEKRIRSANVAPAPPRIPVVTATSVLGNQPVYLTALGSVVAFYTVTLRTRVDGELVSVAANEGQMVSQGDLIAEIDPRPFLVQLEQAQGQKERDEALLANARLDLERYRVLYAQDAIQKQLLDTQAANVRQLEATVKSDQAAIDSAQLNLAYTRIKSPINGRMGLRTVDPGNIVHASDANGLAVITQIQPITVIFNIPQDNVPQVMKQLRAGRRLVVEAWDREMRNRIAAGYLETIDNQADVTTGTVRFKAAFDNADRALFPNQFVNARLLVDVQRGAVLIPAAAIQHGPDSTFVFVVTGDETVEVRKVTVGLIERDMASIQRGLAAGETVVVEGVDRLQQGTRVQSVSR